MAIVSEQLCLGTTFTAAGTIPIPPQGRRDFSNEPIKEREGKKPE